MNVIPFSPGDAFADRTDEQLVGRVQLLQDEAAQLALLERSFSWFMGSMRAAVRRRVGANDLPDADQCVAMAICEAINKYDLWQIDKPRRCRFRTFMKRVVAARLRNFLRDRRRQERHYDHSVQVEHVLDHRALRADVAASRSLGPAPAAGDPARVVEWTERRGLFVDTFTGLCTMMYAVWDDLNAARSLRESADRLGLSYATAKRLQRQMFAALRARFGKEL